MSQPNNTRMRLLSFGIVVCLILTVGGGGTALGEDDLHAASALPVSISLAPNNKLAMPTNCLPDSNEPNNNPSQATQLTSQQIEANFHNTNDVDWFQYTATGGRWYRAFMGTSNYVPSVPYELHVYDQATGQLVGSGEATRDTSGNIDLVTYFIDMFWYVPANGTYLIEVVYPAQAVGLHTCGSSRYSMWIQDMAGWQITGPYQLLGLVYHDDNWSGDWQVEERPIREVTVTLKSAGGAVAATQVTGNDGTFRFNDVAPGLYVVEETDPNGYVSTTSNRLVVRLFRDTVIYFGDYGLPSRGSLQFLPLQLRQ